MKKILIGIAVGIVIIASVVSGAISDRLFGYKILDQFFPSRQGSLAPSLTQQRILTEESVVIEVAEKASPSVVTVSVTKTQRVLDLFEFDPFGIFQQPSGREQKIEQDIGTGFIVSQDGLVVSNKHVVSDTQAKYRVITKDDQEFEVEKIYRDPVNDLAILKINPAGNNLKPIELGDSSNLKVGQFVMAIGTALGEFRHTVTTGVISGLGRGITAGSPFEGYVERLDNVIQSDAAINPGNSGGPLLNSAGQVIGVNVAVAAQGQNIGFAIPINILKESIENFNKTGRFERAFLGVRYRMISQDLALLNEVPQGAYIVEVVSGSPADKAGVKVGDIITKLD
ncbi:MAG TPA: trypsin-like peptidase domain-containing protein, partial [Nevskiaceae bacterium]|nr:trypsin-like peptidase domain-containing protein [Nevskiaceae bacterium]